MDILLSSITAAGLTAALGGLVIWLLRHFIQSHITNAVEFRFESKLETVRAEAAQRLEILRGDLRSKGEDIAALRAGALSAMVSRRQALDDRRIQAVEQLWESVNALAGGRFASQIVSALNYEVALRRAAHDEKAREMFSALGKGVDLAKLSPVAANKARPFVSPLAWALFTAYQTIALQAALKLQMLQLGAGDDFIDRAATAQLVKSALPHRSDFIDRFGDNAYHHLLAELEESILTELRRMLDGTDSDREGVERAAAIMEHAAAANQAGGKAATAARLPDQPG